MTKQADDDGLTWKQQLGYLVLGLIIFFTAAGAAANFTGGSNQIGAGGKLNATSGPLVTLGDDTDLLGGQPGEPDGLSMNISVAGGGHVNFSTSPGEPISPMELTVEQINGSHTVVSSVDSAGNITITPDDKNQSIVNGTLTSYGFNESGVNDTAEDFNYTTSNSPNVGIVTNATQGVQYGAVDTETQEGLAVGTAEQDGLIYLTDLNDGTHSAKIEELGTLFVREETPPHDKITGADVTVTFYETQEDGSPQIVQKSDSDNDGEIDFTGVDVTNQFAVQVEAPNYYNRTILIQDLSQQETVFLLNDSKPAVTNRFTITDISGEFSPAEDSSLEIQKAINRSEYPNGDPPGFSWTTISGDLLGADEAFTTTLEDEQRYRLVIKNQNTGDTTILGSYHATQTETVDLKVGSTRLNLSSPADTAVAYNHTRNDSQLVAGFEDPTGDTTEVKIRAVEWQNTSNVLFSNQSFVNPSKVTYTHVFTGSENESNYIVEYYWHRNGEWHYANSLTVDRPDTVVPADLDAIWRDGIGILLVLTFALIFTQLNVGAGVVASSMIAGLLWWIGLLSGVTTGPAVVAAIFTSLLYSYGTRRGG